jgi:hypothetical protein
MAPVDGLFVFCRSAKKQVKYQLEYVLNGNKVVLPL